jgi:putative DNA primase/helicase
MSEPRPVPIPVSPNTIPAALKSRHHWVCWRYGWHKEKWTKIPYEANGQTKANVTNKFIWSTFEKVFATYQKGEVDGVGYVLSEKQHLVAIDLDHCRDAETGAITDWAQAIVTDLDTYTEVSPSGTGLRLLVKGTLPRQGRKRGAIEAYQSHRYVTITGNHLADTPTTMRPRQAALDAFYQRTFETKARPASQVPHASNGHDPLVDDDALISRAREAKNGAKFSKLWAGDTSGYPSPSEADLALCHLLAFYTQDRAQLDRLFRRSDLYREKWDEPHGEMTYGERTMHQALAHQTEHWTPPRQQHKMSEGDRVSSPGSTKGSTWKQSLSASKDGAVLETLGNVTQALQHLEPWATECWYDTVRDILMVGARELDQNLVTEASLALEAQVKIPMRSKYLVTTALTHLCHQRPRDLLREWLEALPPWDGKARLRQWLHDYAHAPLDAYSQDVSRLIPVSMVARALSPGCQYRYVVILEGREDSGKTKLVRALATPAWYRELSHGLEGKESHMRIKRA